MMYYAGVDKYIGSTTTKCVVLDRERKVVGKTIIPTGVDINKACIEVLSITLKNLNIKENQIKTIVTTGYGRYIPPYAERHRRKSRPLSKVSSGLVMAKNPRLG